MYFASKRDWWLTAVFALTAMVELGVLAVLLPLDRPVFAGTLALAAAAGFFILWVWRGTGYTLTDRGIAVKSGPFRWLVDYGTITVVRRTRNPVSAPALSLDRLELIHGRGGRLLVSPEDQVRFLDELKQRCPGAIIPAE